MSESMFDLFTGMLSGGALGQLSEKLGADDATTSQGFGAAVPAILGGLARNARSQEGAAALHEALAQDHDGSVLDDLGGLLGGSHPQAGKGGKILGHVFGEQQSGVEQQLARSSGLNDAQVQQLLALAAPLVLGWLGKQQREKGLDPGGLAGYLGEQQDIATGHNAGLMGMVMGWLDRDRDGSVMDDIGDIAGGLLGGGKN